MSDRVSNKKDGHKGVRSYRGAAKYRDKLAKRARIKKMWEQQRRIFKFGEAPEDAA